MESNIIKERSIKTIDPNSDIRVRLVGLVESYDEKIGTFEISDRSKKLTCLPPINYNYKPEKGAFVTVVGRIVPADNNEVELRTESIEKISEKEYDYYNKYLNIRGNLLNNGS